MIEIERLLQGAIDDAEMRLWHAHKNHGLEVNDETVKAIQSHVHEWLAAKDEGRPEPEFPESYDLITSGLIACKTMRRLLEEDGANEHSVTTILEYLVTAGCLIGMFNPLPGEYLDRFCEALIADANKKNGSKGGLKRHERMAQLRDWTLARYNAGLCRYPKTPSANAAAYDLREEVLAENRRIGANLTPSNAQNTIRDWILELRKKSA